MVSWSNWTNLKQFVVLHKTFTQYCNVEMTKKDKISKIRKQFYWPHKDNRNSKALHKIKLKILFWYEIQTIFFYLIVLRVICLFSETSATSSPCFCYSSVDIYKIQCGSTNNSSFNFWYNSIIVLKTS